MKKLSLDEIEEMLEDLWETPHEERQIFLATGKGGAIIYLESNGYDLTEKQKEALPHGTYVISGEQAPYYVLEGVIRLTLNELLKLIDEL